LTLRHLPPTKNAQLHEVEGLKLSPIPKQEHQTMLTGTKIRAGNDQIFRKGTHMGENPDPWIQQSQRTKCVKNLSCATNESQNGLVI